MKMRRKVWLYSLVIYCMYGPETSHLPLHLLYKTVTGSILNAEIQIVFGTVCWGLTDKSLEWFDKAGIVLTIRSKGFVVMSRAGQGSRQFLNQYEKQQCDKLLGLIFETLCLIQQQQRHVVWKVVASAQLCKFILGYFVYSI